MSLGGTVVQQRTWRIGVDVGGTFTDMVVADSEGAIQVHKVPSVPSDPAEAVMAAVERAAAAERLTMGEFLSRTTLFVHGSTVATNTVLEAKGATVGLIVTEGFRDFLEIRRGQRDNPWDHRAPYPPVLVPRYRRLPVTGRIDRDGGEATPLNEADVESIVDAFRDEGVDSVAICLFNSFLNGQHEDTAGKMIALRMPGTHVSASHVVAPIMGEYERGSTTVLNAYVAPRTVGYLRALDQRLADIGLTVPLLLTQNNGGSISLAESAERPITLLLSGPAAGVGALAFYAEAIGSEDLISMEIGGTSCDVILMAKGDVAFVDHLDIAGYNCVSPSVEVHTVAAGGGTIARVDSAGLLHVGPQGAGARPGPACYGLGGTLPTITDAEVVLGRLHAGPYAGGSVTIHADLARRAIEEHVARPLGLSLEAAAAGMIRLIDQNLLHAVQRLSTQRGYDPKRFTLVAGGGAGPLHGAAVGRALGCSQIFLPRLSGAFCALGMLQTDVRHDLVRAYSADLDAQPDARLASLFDALEREAASRLLREGFEESETQISRALDIRYVGQQWDITVPVSQDLDPAAVRQDFDREHDRLFGHTQPGGAIEITKARVTGVGRLPTLSHNRRELTRRELKPTAHRKVWIDQRVGWRETPVYRGADLHPGHRLVGPAIIEEETTTALVGATDVLVVDVTGNYVLTLGEAHPAARKTAEAAE